MCNFSEFEGRKKTREKKHNAELQYADLGTKVPRAYFPTVPKIDSYHSHRFS